MKNRSADRAEEDPGLRQPCPCSSRPQPAGKSKNDDERPGNSSAHVHGSSIPADRPLHVCKIAPWSRKESRRRISSSRATRAGGCASPVSAAGRSFSTSTPRTRPPAVRRRPAGSATRGIRSRRPARSSSASARDDEASHAQFKSKFGLPFTLLADPDHAVCDLYDTWVEYSFDGHNFFAAERSTFVIDDNGIVKKIMRKVDPELHAGDVLAALAA